MASRKITDLLFTGGMDTVEDGSLDVIKPDAVLMLHPYDAKKFFGRIPTSQIVVGHKETPTLLQIQEIAGFAGILQAERKLLVMCNDGSQRSCTAAAIIQAALNKEPFTRVVNRIVRQFQTPEQGNHTWFPYSHWYTAICKHWSTVLKDL